MKLYVPNDEIGHFIVKKGENIPGCSNGMLGQGGMGVVYYAVNKFNLSEVVALKTLRPENQLTSDDHERFKNEAVVWSKLETHENIVQAKTFFLNDKDQYNVIDLTRRLPGTIRVQRPFLAIEYIEGRNLSNLIEKEECLHPLQACLYGTQFCMGMMNARERMTRGKDAPQLLHRDISPDNIMISKNRNIVKINDFGLSRFFSQEISGHSMIAGKLLFMPPEILLCTDRHTLKLSVTTDIWAFGVTLYQCLVGHLPYFPRTRHELDAIARSDQRWFPGEMSTRNTDMVKVFDDLVGACFHRDPSNRPQSWKEVHNRLRKIQARLEAMEAAGRLYYCDECGFIQNNTSSPVCSLCGSRQMKTRSLSTREEMVSLKSLSRRYSQAPSADAPPVPSASEKPGPDRRPEPGDKPDTGIFQYRGIDCVAIPAGSHRCGLNPERIQKLMDAMYTEQDRKRIPVSKLAAQQAALLKKFPMAILNLPGYAISVFPVTNQQYMEFIRETGYTPESRSFNPGGSQDEDKPVVNISVTDAQAYCHWGGFRLPTIHEWQYAASGGDDRLYPWGDTFDSRWINDARQSFKAPVSVHAFEDNTSEFGLRQMGGNVREFVDSGSVSGKGMVTATMGGSYASDGKISGSIHQITYQDSGAGGARPDLGFRVCRAEPVTHTPAFVTIDSGHFIAGCKPEFARALLDQFNLPEQRNLDLLLSFSYTDNAFTDAFQISRFPVTNGEYLAFVRQSSHPPLPGWRRSNLFGPFFRQEEHLPATGVSFQNALAYCNWAGCRLPTALEWEKAARGTTGRHYPWGDIYEVTRCNTAENRLGRPSSPHEFPLAQSPFGLLDMCGNVSEYALKPGRADVIERRGGSWRSTCEIYGTAFYGISCPASYPADTATGFRTVKA